MLWDLIVKLLMVKVYVLEKDKTIPKLYNIFDKIIYFGSIFGILSTIIGTLIWKQLFYIGVTVLLLIFIIEVISLIFEVKNAFSTYELIKEEKLANKKELENIRVILNVYRLNKLSGIVYSIIKIKKEIS